MAIRDWYEFPPVTDWKPGRYGWFRFKDKSGVWWLMAINADRKPLAKIRRDLYETDEGKVTWLEMNENINARGVPVERSGKIWLPDEIH